MLPQVDAWKFDYFNDIDARSTHTPLSASLLANRLYEILVNQSELALFR